MCVVADADPPRDRISVSVFQRIRETIVMYSELGKIRLGSMVVATTMVGYYMAPFSAFNLTR